MGNWYIVWWLRWYFHNQKKKCSVTQKRPCKFLLSDGQRQLVRSDMASEGGRFEERKILVQPSTAAEM